MEFFIKKQNSQNSPFISKLLIYSIIFLNIQLVSAQYVSRGKPEIVSSYATNSRDGSKALNGNSQSYWETSSSSLPQWIEIDLNHTYTIDELFLRFESNASRFTYFTFEAFYNGSWSTILDIDNDVSTGSRTYTFPAVNAEKVRLTIEDLWNSSNTVQLNRLDVSGSLAVLPPDNVGSSNIGNSSFEASWGSVTGADNYIVNLDGIDYSTTTTSYDFTNLSGGTTYGFTVSSVLGGNQSIPSASVLATTKCDPPVVTIDSYNSTSANFSWGAVTNADHYLVTVEDAATGQPVAGYSELNTTVLLSSPNNLVPGVNYEVIVKAVDPLNRTSSWITRSFSTPLSAPVANNAAGIGFEGFDASWSAVSGALEYRLDLSNGQSYLSSTNSISVNGLNPETDYNYVVYAISNGIESPASNQITFTTGIAPPSSAPSGLSGGPSINVSWTAVGNASSYNLYISDVADFSSHVLGYNGKSISGTSEEIYGLQNGTLYFIRVQAENGSGVSEFSETISITTPSHSSGSPFSLTNSGSSYSIDNFNIGIGTATPSEKLEVNGTIRSKKVMVEITGWPDFVFESGYDLKTLKELESYILEFKHLPELPSAIEVETKGLEIGNMQKTLLKKIEELTLYTIEQQKKIESQEEKYIELLNKVNKLTDKSTNRSSD